MAYPHRLRNLQSWQRFTLLDMLLIQAAFGIGIALATLFSGLRGYRSTVPCHWTDRAGSWASVLFGLWTLCLFLPFVLSA
ncbi:MAG: hypothetical protein ABIK89_06720 [Planctomycetota bacterium]